MISVTDKILDILTSPPNCDILIVSDAEGVCIRSGTILPPWIEKVKRKHSKQRKKHRKPVLFPFDGRTRDSFDLDPGQKR